MIENSFTGQLHLDRSHPVLVPPDLSLQPLSVDHFFWGTAHERPELQDGRLLSVFDYERDWTWWERHPFGDELVYVLAGEMQFLLEDGKRQWSVDLTKGNACIVPERTWHSARVTTPSKVLFVTPAPARTEHRDFE